MTWTSTDLARLPPPEIIETLDYEVILAALKADFVARWPDFDVGMLESDPAVKVLEVAAYRELVLRARINDAIRSNLLAFAGGSDLEHLAIFYGVQRMAEGGSYESDARLRTRVILEIQGRSTGGTAPRYRAAALASSLRVEDAIVYREGRDPTVHVAVYAADNDGLADEALLATVATALNAPSVRMVNDIISVRSAVFQVVNVAADVWLLPETPDAALTDLVTALRASWAAETGLGFDLTHAWLTARLMRAGVQKVVVTAPAADVVADPYRAISLGSISLTNRGRAY